MDHLASEGVPLVAQMVKNLPTMQKTGSIPGSGRSPEEWQPIPGFLENLMDRRTCQAKVTVYGVAQELDTTE